jgi:hypothetical protein
LVLADIPGGDCLHDLSKRPWREIRNGKEITDLWLVQRLQPHDVGPRTVRIGDTRAKGYFEDDLKDAFQCYISNRTLKQNELTFIRRHIFLCSFASFDIRSKGM